VTPHAVSSPARVRSRNQPPSRCAAHASCGQHHDLPLSFGPDEPGSYLSIPEEERESRTLLSSEQCIIEQRWFFVRGVIELPIIGADHPLAVEQHEEVATDRVRAAAAAVMHPSP
jgi:hypothetical protein